MKTRANHGKKSRLNSPKNHTCRWYDDTQFCKISCSNSTLLVRYKNNKFQDRKLSRWFVGNLLFLYLTNEVEFGQDILQNCVSSYHLHVWFFGEFRRFFYRGLHGFSRRLWFAPDTFPIYSWPRWSRGLSLPLEHFSLPLSFPLLSAVLVESSPRQYCI